MSGLGAATVGVVVPAYQAERWLPMTLKSLQQQGFGDWVCVVVDDGSRDGTARVVREITEHEPRIRLLQKANAGVTAARNTGIAALPDVELLALVDSDDLLLPDAFELLVAALRARPDAVGAYGLAEHVDATGARVSAGVHPAVQRSRRRYVGGRWWGRLEPVAGDDDLALSELVVNNPFWPPATGMVRAAAVREVGGLDESYRVQEDWELWLRLQAHGPFVALDRVVAEYRRHDGNATLDDLANVQTQARLRASLARAWGGSRDDLVTGAWRALQRGRLFHLVWLASRGLRDRDPLLVALAVAALVLVAPQLLLTGPPVPGRLFAVLRRWEARADARVRRGGG